MVGPAVLMTLVFLVTVIRKVIDLGRYLLKAFNESIGKLPNFLSPVIFAPFLSSPLPPPLLPSLPDHPTVVSVPGPGPPPNSPCCSSEPAIEVVRNKQILTEMVVYLEAGSVPGEIGGDPEDELIVDGAPTPHTQGRQGAQACEWWETNLEYD